METINHVKKQCETGTPGFPEITNLKLFKMKKLTIITCLFTLITVSVQSNTEPRNNETKAVTANTPVVIELGYTTIRAGLATAATPNVVFNASINWSGSLSKSNLASVLTQVFNRLNVTPSDHPVMITNAPESKTINDEVMAEVLMGTLKVPAMYLSSSHGLALYTTGKSEGVVAYLQSDNGSNIITNSACIRNGIVSPISVSIGNHQSLDVAKFSAQIHNESIASIPPTERYNLYPNILLIGNDSRVPEIRAELESKIKPLAPATADVIVTVPSDYKLTVWKGAKKLAEQSYFLDLCFTQADYARDGKSGIHKKVY